MDVTVYPEHDNFPAIARALLAAADHPGQVVSVSHPKAGFIVPQEVFLRFQAAVDAKVSSTDERAPAQAEPVKRRPGRPRKNTDPGKEE